MHLTKVLKNMACMNKSGYLSYNQPEILFFVVKVKKKKKKKNVFIVVILSFIGLMKIIWVSIHGCEMPNIVQIY